MKKTLWTFLLFHYMLLATAQSDDNSVSIYSKGTSTAIKWKRIDPDSVASPEVIPVRQAQRREAKDNVYPVGKPVITTLNPADFTTVTPGENGAPMPKRFKIPAEKVPALRSPRTKALPPAFKDVATHDIRYLDIDQGMANSYVFGLCEDSKGYLWFAGWIGGVWRYDGVFFTQFTMREGLPDDEVSVIYEDHQQQLWFGTKNGLTKYDGQSFTNYIQLPDHSAFNVWTIAEDKDHKLWIASLDEGIYRFDGQHFEHFTTAQGLLSNTVSAILKGMDGRLWFATDQGLCYFDGQSFTQVRTAEVDAPSEFYDLTTGEAGDIWAATNRGLTRYDGTAFYDYTKRPSFRRPSRLVIDESGNTWLGGSPGSLWKFDGNAFMRYSEKEGLSQDDVLNILVDQEEQIWASTYGGGVNKINPNSFTQFTDNDLLTRSMVNQIMEDSADNLWFATEFNGVVKYDGRSFTYYNRSSGLISNSIQYILEDSAGNLWFSSFIEGVSKFDGATFTNYTTEQGLAGNQVWSMLEDEQGRMWFATEENGLCRYDGGTFTQLSETEGLSSNTMPFLYQDQQNNIWCTGAGGAGVFTERAFRYLSTADSLSENNVVTMLQDSRGHYWFGHFNNGVSRYDGQSFQPFGKEQGMEDTHIWAMTKDERGNIWVGTEKGLHLFWFPDDASNSDPTIIPLRRIDGMKGEDVRQGGLYIDQRNQLWVATGKGVMYLDLDAFYEAMDFSPPSLYLTNVLLDETFIDFTNDTILADLPQGIRYDSAAAFQNYPLNLAMPYNINTVSFEFAAIDFSAPHKIRYQYQLEGLENSWSPTTADNRIDYRSLSFGSYTFKVRAKIGPGDWGEPIAYSFRILPPWWHSWWAYGLYLMLFAGLLYLGYLFLKRRLLLQNELNLQAEEARRLKELDTFKSRLYTNLTHEFRTPLTVILGMTQQIRNEPKKYVDKGTRLIENNGKNLLRLINQLLDLSKLEDESFKLQLQQNDIVPYLRYITESFHTYANSKNLSLRFFSNRESLLMDYDPEQLQQVLTNLISNALKFTPPDGDVLVKLTGGDQQLQIEVRDTGIGIAEKDLQHVFDRFYQADDSSTRKGEGTGIGLAHTQELVKLMGGTIDVESEVGKGTRFLVILPVRREAALVTTELQSLANLHLSELSKDTLTLSVTENDLPQLLIIEDNQDVVIYLKTCLEGQYDLQVAYNGKIGIDKALEYIPDLIVSDVMMPEKDGYEVCDTLKNDERTSHIPIVLLTAKADAPSKIVGLRRGADAYLTKPFDKEELLVRLEMLVQRQKRMVAHFSQAFLSTRPAEQESEEAIQVESAFLQKVQQIVAAHYQDENFALPQLCQKIGMSRSQLFRKMKALIDTSPSAFIRDYRLKQAKELLETTDLNVSEVAWQVGFKNVAHFSKSFQDHFGHAPSATSK